MVRIKPTIEGNKIIVTQHVQKQAKKRLNMSPYALTNIAKKAYVDGINIKNSDDKLKYYIIGKYKSEGNANNIRIYGHYTFIFKNNVLATVYQLPQDLWQYWDNRGEVVENK
jgi:hypothetical protein